MGELARMQNIGIVIEQKLVEAGISTPQQLKELGSREAFLRLKLLDPGACLNMLCGLEGAIRGVRWHELPADVRRELRAFYLSLKG